MPSNSSEKDLLVAEASYGTADTVNVDEGGGSFDEPEPLLQRVTETLKLYWHLGFIGFGGPTAHVAIFRDHLVRVNKFIEEDVFMELFALCTSMQSIRMSANCHQHLTSSILYHPNFIFIRFYRSGTTRSKFNSTNHIYCFDSWRCLCWCIGFHYVVPSWIRRFDTLWDVSIRFR